MNRLRYTASGRLGLWDSLDDLGGEEWRSQLNELLQLNANGVIESEIQDFTETNDPFLASVTAVCDKIISRGNPTLVDPNWEQALLSGPGNELLRWKEIDDKEIRFTILECLWPEGNIHRLLESAKDLLDLPWNAECTQMRQLLPVDLQDLCSPEEEALYAGVIEKLGVSASGAVQRQALIADLVGGGATTALSDSRVDFAVQKSRIKWVIEVDGNQHQEPSQRSKDKFRDIALQAGGWKVMRVEAEKVRSCLDDWLHTAWDNAEGEEVLSLNVEADLGSVKEIIESSLMYRAAWQLLLRPLALQKCMRGLLMMYRHGALDASRPQRILVIEEDVPVVADAFQMLMELWELTTTLQPHLSVGPPDFQLDVIGEKGLGCAGHNVRFVERPDGVYDTVISHSLLLGEGHCSPRLEELESDLTFSAIHIRRAIGNRTDRALLGAPGLNRPLDNSRQLPEKILKRFLQLVFRKKDFNDGQLSSIRRLSQGNHSIVLLPTGGGKSLVYQFVGMLMPGMTIVVDPIISLMDDQVRSLKEMGIDRAEGISSQTENIEIAMHNMVEGKFHFIFVSPERLQSEKFRNELQKVTGRFPIPLVALDEAHCLSEWGHDFRPAYLNLPQNLQRHCKDPDTEAVPTLVALTGTASYAVLEDMQAELAIDSEEAIIRPESFDREELNFLVRQISGRGRTEELLSVSKELPQYWNMTSEKFDELNGEMTKAGLVFCPHVDGRLGIAQIARELGHKNYYGGKVPRNFSSDWNPCHQNENRPLSESALREHWKKHKRELQQKFLQNKLQEMVATKSFGMGIDKRNIRYTIHYVMPASVEQFYQEAGRAGRDGKEAHCTIIYIDAGTDKAITEILDEPDHAKATANLDAMGKKGSQADILIPLYFLLRSFSGREEEKDSLIKLWREFLESGYGTDRGNRIVDIPFWNEEECGQREKCIYRLRILGIVKDYTVKYMELEPKQKGWFLVETGDGNVDKIRECLSLYLSKYKFQGFVQKQVNRVNSLNLSEAVEQAVEVLIDFIYDAVVAKRKEAIRNMAQLCRDFEDSESFRASILAYLEESPFTEQLNEWRRKSFGEIGLGSIREVLNDLEKQKNGDDLGLLRGLIGTTRRVLEAEPENVALRYLSVCSRAASPWETKRSVVGEANTLFVSARTEELDMDWLRRELLQDILRWRPGAVGSVANSMFAEEDGLDFARGLLREGRGYGDHVRIAALSAISSNVVRTVRDISGFYDLKLVGELDDTRVE